MNFWNEKRIREALPGAKLYNFPPEWSAVGLIIWHDNIRDDAMVLIRRKGERRGMLPRYLDKLISQVAAIVCTNAKEFLHYNKPIIEIKAPGDNTIVELARYKRKFYKGKVAAITGSSGKTTTTRIVYDVLSHKNHVSANLNKFNTTWGISWNISCFDLDAKYWVVETSLGGGVSRNSAITKPDYAVITNIAPVHLKDGMTLRDIADEKSKIYNSMKEGAIAILYREAEYIDFLRNTAIYKGLKVITFGEHSNSDIQIIENGFRIEGKDYLLNCKPLAKHILLDMAAAIAIAREEKIPMEEVMEVLSNFVPLEGRGELNTIKLSDKTIHLIDESYNANPVSMKAAIEGFGQLFSSENKILLLGDMAECGVESAKYHIQLAEHIRKISPQKIILCGKEIKPLYNTIKDEYNVLYYETIEKLNDDILNQLEDNAYIMAKSSNSSGLHTTVELIKKKVLKF